MGCDIIAPYNLEKFRLKIKNAIEPLINEEVDVILDDSQFQALSCKVNLAGSNPWNGGVVSFHLTMLPGCCGYLVSHESFVYYEFRRKGIATVLQSIKEEIAREEGYTHMMCTTMASNMSQNRILEKHGWTKVHEGVNGRTNNNLYMWVKHVPRDVEMSSVRDAA